MAHCFGRSCFPKDEYSNVGPVALCLLENVHRETFGIFLREKVGSSLLFLKMYECIETKM